MRYLSLLLGIAMLLASCGHAVPNLPSETCEMPTGVLVFVRDTTGMGSAIAAATGEYTHVAIVVCTDSGDYLYESLPRRGVLCRPVQEAFYDWYTGMDSTYPFLQYVSFRTIDVPFDTLRLRQCLAQCVGQPYDDAFLPDNGRMYCSELVYECFYSPDGSRLFESQPMNFRAADGTMPSYWVHHFDSLGIAIPEGVPGTNPTALYAAPILRDCKYE